jgi:magnesium chelatase family protein
MSLALSHARARFGLSVPLVTIEVHLTGGLPAFNLVGLAATAVRESRERVRSAILNAGFEFPERRLTINLAPADLPKEGTRFDLAIALGILAASGQIPAAALAGHEFSAELALTGALRPVGGILPVALSAHQAGRSLVCAPEDVPEAHCARGARILAPTDLRAICGHLSGATPLSPAAADTTTAMAPTPLPCLSEVQGQAVPRRALEIAAAGGHNLLMVGPPGTGKTLLATRLPGLLPPLDDAAALESAIIRSLAGHPPATSDWHAPPFRAPHHTASGAALVGGGSVPRPGEISLAHRGVLFLDELPEFQRRVLEVIREPLESGEVTVSRAGRQVTFPAAFQLVAAMNPCPCGYAGDVSGRCLCTPERIERYRATVSGPLLDRIDLHLEVTREPDWLGAEDVARESSASVATRVAAARAFAAARQGHCNARLTPAGIKTHAALGPPARAMLTQAYDRLHLSPRGFHRLLRVARTIADLAGVPTIRPVDLAEALSLRRQEQATGSAMRGV